MRRPGSGVRALAALGAALLLESGCAARYGVDYLHPDTPRCAARFAGSTPDATPDEPFRLASFNVQFANRPDLALGTLRKAGLDSADVLLLQEMDLPGTAFLARELGMDYVYYPAAIHPHSGRQFGVATLSRWPIRDDRKLFTPLIRSSDDARKASLVATVWIHGVPVVVVNAHLSSGLDPVWLGDQLQFLTLCLEGGECLGGRDERWKSLRHVVFAGDLNTRSEAHRAVAREVLGWAGLTQVPGIGKTHKLLPGGELDHIFVTQETLRVEASGVVGGFFHTGSDHRPIWAKLRFEGPVPEPWEGFADQWLADTPADAGECPVRRPSR